MEIEKRLYEVAVEGDVTVLLELLERDALLLDRLTLNNYKETPLHIAAMRGHVDFVKLILTTNPHLAAELNSQRSSPLHIASAKGNLEIVKELLVVNPEMCLAPDVHGRNPLHLAAIKGHVEVIKELIQMRPGAAVATTNDGDNILHLALVNNQIETVKYLVRSNKIEVNLKHHNGNTAPDVLAHKDLQITKNTPSSSIQHVPNNDQPQHKQYLAGDWLSKKRDSIMVVASLIATMAFQAGMNPPGGVWQENDDSLQDPHKAGEAVMAYKHPKAYRYFIRTNTIAFVASLSTILLLISGLPFTRRLFLWALMVIMWLTVTSVALTYGISIYIVTPKKDREQLGQVIELAVSVWCFVMALLLLGNTIRLLFKWMKKKQQSRKPAPGNSTTLLHTSV